MIFSFFFNTVLLQYVPSLFIPFLPPTSILSLQNALWKQLLIFNKLLESYKLISLNISPIDPKLVKHFESFISTQAENRLSAPKQVAMQAVTSKLVSKIYLLSRLK